MNAPDSNSTYHQLRNDILDGSIEPSSKLSIAQLSSRYNSSAAPVREALSRLAAEGLVIRKGQRGYWAAPVSVDEFVDVARLREMLEVDAFRQSIRHGDLDWEASIAGARHRELTVRRNAEGHYSEHAGELIRENRRFHMALISGCPSAWQLRFISTLYDQSERFRRLSLISLAETTPAGDEHEAIMEAAFRRDEEEACSLLKAHIEHSNQRVIDTLFPERGATGPR
ncbi:GntR family transcriptional regulator [Marinobacterium zhoushanense]|uniref:GntR family transcriptional regulator n=1 Tax=Marinobacterium zhoushanense TaxID=1679163 RepID=A0ABQ1KGA3_9GAMM|nr:GntR family transcriptional regulator [Marinobacterium zhoushanense]GGB94917.1 GntR family transcriptional regulator [Marinobacterium zhoushanense]